jgi:patatin-related protein
MPPEQSGGIFFGRCAIDRRAVTRQTLAIAQETPPAVPDTVEVDDLQELRLALVMEGGVSLAVWEGGVALEVGRLVRGECSAYNDLLSLTGATCRVDVISGTSAGGLNGALLAMALSHNKPLGAARDLWLKQGGLDALLRSPFEKDPPSLLRGNEYFLPRLRDAFAELSAGPVKPTEELPIRLTMTTTLMAGTESAFEDDFGALIPDISHKGEFRFMREGGRDDFAEPHAPDRLAVASRSTASFPFAFEPSFISIEDDPARTDMTGFTNFRESQYVLDGGVLVGKPFEAAIRDVFALPAERQVRRVMAFVSPDPAMKKVKPGTSDEIPNLLTVALDSAMRLPRAISISAELNAIDEHNRRVAGQQKRRELLLTSVDADHLEDFASRLVDAYWERKGREWAETMAARLPGEPSRVDVAGINAEVRRQVRSELFQAWLADAPNIDITQPGALDRQWSWDVESVQRAALVVLDLLKRALGLTLPGDPSTTEERERLRTLRGKVHEQLAILRRVRARRLALFSKTLPPTVGDDADAKQLLASWAEQAVAEWRSMGDDLPNVAREIATVLVQAREDLSAATQRAEKLSGLVRSADTLQKMAGPLVQVHERSREAEIDTAFRRLLAVEIITSVIGGDRALEQPVQLVQVSTNTPNGLDTRQLGSEKVAGVQLAHFAAFYKRSWRANDWMWGRVDGAMKLVQILLEPARLRQLRVDAKKVGDAVEVIAKGPMELHEVTGEPGAVDRKKIDEELVFLVDMGARVPQFLPYCSQVVARRVQAEILTEEVLEVEAAVRHDIESGARPTADARDFLDEAAPVRERVTQSGGRPTPAEAVRLFRTCRIGRERIGDEKGSDLFTSTTATAASVGVSATTGARSGLPAVIRGGLRALRGVVLLVYAVLFSAVRGSRTAFALCVFSLAVGGALLGLALFEADVPGFLLAIGAALLFFGFVLAFTKSLAWAVAGLAPLGVAIALAIWQGDAGWKSVWLPLAVVAGSVLTAVLLGALVNKPQK